MPHLHETIFRYDFKSWCTADIQNTRSNVRRESPTSERNKRPDKGPTSERNEKPDEGPSSERNEWPDESQRETKGLTKGFAANVRPYIGNRSSYL